MRRLLGALAQRAERPRTQVRIWFMFTSIWLALTPVTMVTFLAHSVPWLEFMSLFANSASCATALVAALALVRADAAARTADHIAAHHPNIPPMEGAANGETGS